MKGLKEYIGKHGKHFTEELAHYAAVNAWSGRQVEKAAQRKVYYNVTGSTLGDMVYLTNENWKNWGFKTIHGAINYVLYFIGDYTNRDGRLFDEWVEEMQEAQADFDFTPYI